MITGSPYLMLNRVLCVIAQKIDLTKDNLIEVDKSDYDFDSIMVFGYQVQCDEKLNTQDEIDKNELKAKVKQIVVYLTDITIHFEQENSIIYKYGTYEYRTYDHTAVSLED